MDSQLLIEIIAKYELYIEKGNEILKKNFNLTISPLLAKRQGIIPISGKVEVFSDNWMIFTFHGMGCKFEFENIIVDFDYTFEDFVYKGFEKLKLYRFIKSYASLNYGINEFDFFNEAILKLENEGVIKKNESIDTYDYIFFNPAKDRV